MIILGEKFNKDHIFNIKANPKGGRMITFGERCLKEDFLEEVISELGFTR